MARKSQRSSRKTSPAPGPFVVFLVDRINEGRPHRLLPRLPKKSKATKRLIQTTTLGRYAATYQTTEEAVVDAVRRNLPSRYRFIVASSEGIDFSPVSRGNLPAVEPPTLFERGTHE